ncbi:hypothetical protein KC320_g86 [Hortaea werneckii]|nr:hypothetical protein KC320_g86 [Hortaea werneckii]
MVDGGVGKGWKLSSSSSYQSLAVRSAAFWIGSGSFPRLLSTSTQALRPSFIDSSPIKLSTSSISQCPPNPASPASTPSPRRSKMPASAPPPAASSPSPPSSSSSTSSGANGPTTAESPSTRNSSSTRAEARRWRST